MGKDGVFEPVQEVKVPLVVEKVPGSTSTSMVLLTVPEGGGT